MGRSVNLLVSPSDYRGLADRVFHHVEQVLRRDLFRVPYDHAILTCHVTTDAVNPYSSILYTSPTELYCRLLRFDLVYAHKPCPPRVASIKWLLISVHGWFVDA